VKVDRLLCFAILAIYLKAKTNLGVDRLALAGQVPINDCSVTVAGNHGEGIVEKELRGSGRRVVGNRIHDGKILI
jgi:hypothetical protein